MARRLFAASCCGLFTAPCSGSCRWDLRALYKNPRMLEELSVSQGLKFSAVTIRSGRKSETTSFGCGRRKDSVAGSAAGGMRARVAPDEVDGVGGNTLGVRAGHVAGLTQDMNSYMKAGEILWRRQSLGKPLPKQGGPPGSSLKVFHGQPTGPGEARRNSCHRKVLSPVMDLRAGGLWTKGGEELHWLLAGFCVNDGGRGICGLDARGGRSNYPTPQGAVVSASCRDNTHICPGIHHETDPKVSISYPEEVVQAVGKMFWILEWRRRRIRAEGGRNQGPLVGAETRHCRPVAGGELAVEECLSAEGAVGLGSQMGGRGGGRTTRGLWMGCYRGRWQAAQKPPIRQRRGRFTDGIEPVGMRGRVTRGTLKGKWRRQSRATRGEPGKVYGLFCSLLFGIVQVW
ncbi:hypothetical protein E2C01_034228 [Portunus trituberculatus]|uniref:Uncharacterized protein n=1 Tax=Portunus trituberculatus TaxID=210409 RepID=A0A5B7F6I9_PORTR|nr:hypothetical protein [Portunus trituberculatus]